MARSVETVIDTPRRRRCRYRSASILTQLTDTARDEWQRRCRRVKASCFQISRSPRAEDAARSGPLFALKGTQLDNVNGARAR
jgi:hypothetical protein